jgi:mannose-6-phosphate isomerase-like protein (cupin superfamily)
VARKGTSIYNPVTTEHLTFLTTTEETDGEYLEFECRVGTNGIPLPPHVHDTQEERFEILSGKLGVMLGGEIYELRPGEKAVLPVGVKHQWWNAGETEVAFRVVAAPARNLEAVLEANAGMAIEGKLNKKSAMPKNPFHMVNLGRLGETYLPVVPIALQKMMLAMGSVVGRAFGVDPKFAYYRAVALDLAQEVAVEAAEAAA